MVKSISLLQSKICLYIFPKNGKISASVLALTYILILLLQMFLPQGALGASRSYTIDNNQRVPIPETYVLRKVINNAGSLGKETGYFKSPDDLFINAQGYLFVADTENNRVVKLTREGNILGIYKGPDSKPLSSPKGIFADDSGNMYIADTGNLRIVHLSAQGEFIEEFVKPDSELLGANFTFDPSKLYVSPTGYIYAIKGKSIVTIDAHNRFRGYMGQTDIGFSLVDALIRMFASEEQRRVTRKRAAEAYTNITMDEKGMIYASSRDMTEGEIKKLNSVGKNIYKKYGKKLYTLPEILKRSLSLEGKSYILGERKDDDYNTIKPLFCDLAVDGYGIITALEEQTGKLFQYDQDGNLLTVFGGKGEQKGRFGNPSSVVTDSEGKIYVLDRTMGNIQVFEPTEFIKKIHKAVFEYSRGSYDEAYELWKAVLSTDDNYELAHKGLANALYKKEQWSTAMEEYKLAGDREGYSKAYIEYRYSIFRKYFIVVVLALIAIIAVLVFLISRMRRVSEKSIEYFSKKHQGRMGISQGLRISLGVVFHPLETFEKIKSGRGRLNPIPGALILITVLAIRVFYLYQVHYPLADVDLDNSNILLEAVKLLLPPLTWVVASYAITAILDGESKITEIFLASCYCMVPYILVTFPLALFSKILTRNETTIYGLLMNGMWIWIFLLFFASLKTLNDYKLFKTAATYVVSGATIALVWFVGMLGYVLSGRLYQFVTGIAHEIRMKWL